MVVLLLCLAASPLAATTGTITGTVTDATTRAPLRDAVVEVWTAEGSWRAAATTDVNGAYEIRLFPAGRYRFLAYDPAGKYATAFDRDAESFETTPVTAVGATSGGTTHRADFALVRGGRAAGFVTDVQGRVRAGLAVAAYNPSGTRRGFTTTNSDGSWSILLPPGGYRIAVYDPSVNPVWATIFHPNARAYADATPITIVASATVEPIDLRVDRAARVTGEVRNDGGVGIEGVLVYAYTAEGALVTSSRADVTGRYALVLPPGAYRLVAADPQSVWATLYYPSERSFVRSPQVAVAAGESRLGIDFTVSRAASIGGRITTPVGPFEGIDVGAFNADGSLHTSTRTALDGSYTLTVAPGELRIAAWDSKTRLVTRFHPAAADFDSATALHPSAGSVLSAIDVTMVEGGRLKGVVRDAITKLPIQGAAVAAYDVLGAPAGDGRTGADGRYVFAAVPGDLRLVAFDPLMRYAAAYPGSGSFDGGAPVSAARGQDTTVEFELKRGVVVTGSIVDPWGTPLDRIEVFALDDAGRRVAAATAAEGAFAMVLVPGRYHFVAVDPMRRFAPRHYPAAASFEAGSPVDIANGPNASIALAFDAASGRRRAARH